MSDLNVFKWLSTPVAQWYFLMLSIGFVAGVLLTLVWNNRRTNALKEKNVRLEIEIEHLQAEQQQQLESFDILQERSLEQFTQLSQLALKENSDRFLQLAEENLRRQVSTSGALLSEKQQAIGHLLAPLNVALEKTMAHMQVIEKERQQKYGALNQQIMQLSESEALLRKETHQLTAALKQPGISGRWGEMTLQRIIELSGMQNFVDFDAQTSISTAEGNIRPDVVIKLPNNGLLVVDAKTPLSAYLDALEADTDALKKVALDNHSKNVRQRVRELSAKAYWSQFDNSPDFVIMFIPGEQFLSVALEQDRDLLEDAMKQKIILSTPSSLMALLRVIAMTWKQNDFANNASTIKTLAEELHKRAATLTTHVANVGNNLGKTVDSYNLMIGSIEQQLTPQLRKMSELGIQEKKQINDLQPLHHAVRMPRDDQ